jgi:hypothetical protein
MRKHRHPILEIIEKNNATFYTFRDRQGTKGQSGLQVSWSRYLLVLSISFLIWLLGVFTSEKVLTSIISVQSILIGFGLTVMFYIVSTTTPKIEGQQLNDVPDPNIENGLKLRLIADMQRELFENISYFMLIAVVSLVFALLILVERPMFDVADLNAKSAQVFVIKIYAIIHSVLANVVSILFVFSVVESTLTFCRVALRLNILFAKKLDD